MARTRTIGVVYEDLRGSGVEAVRGLLTIPEAQAVRYRLGVRVEIGAANPAACGAPSGQWIELGYMHVRGARCGQRDGYEGFYFATDRKPCVPVFVGGLFPGAKHPLEVRFVPDVGIYRLFVGKTEVGRVAAFEAPIAAVAAGLNTESLPAESVGPFAVEKLQLKRAGRWRRWVPRSSCAAPSECTVDYSKRRSAVSASCESVFGRRIATQGEEACLVKRTGSVVCWYADVVVGAMLEVDDAVEVAGGGAHACVRTSKEQVQCWGSNSLGQLGVGSREDGTIPAFVPGLSSVRSVAAGSNHSCAVTADGSVWCWGSNSQRQLGVDGDSRTTPVRVEGLSGASQVAAAGNLSCARMDSGEVWCWGAVYDPAVQLPMAKPVAVHGISDAADIAVGVEHGCAVRTGGGVECWGRRVEEYHSGALPSRRPGLRTVRGLGDATQLAMGRLHGCALRGSGDVVCWGYNRYGQLGVGDNEKTSYPQKVVGVADAIAVASGRDHVCVLTKRAVQCWGGHFGRDFGPCERREGGKCPTRYVRYGTEPRLIGDLRP